MSPKRRVTKHMMKEDKLVTAAFKLTEFVQKNLNRVLLFTGIVVVLILVVVFFLQVQTKRNQKAEILFSKARIELSSGNLLQAINDLNTISLSYGGTKIAPQALFLLGNAYFYSKNYDQALKSFENFSIRYKDDPQLLASALAGMAQCYFEKKEYLLAGDYFIKATQVDLKSFLTPNFFLQAGYSYQNGGNLKKTKDAFQKIIEFFPESKEAYQAKIDLAEITYGDLN